MAPLQSSSKRSANTLTNSLKMQTTAAGLLSTLIDYGEGQQQQQDSISINNESLMKTTASADSKTAVDDKQDDDKKKDNDANGAMSNSSSVNDDIPPAATLDLQNLDEKTKTLIPKRASDSSNSEDDGKGISFSNVDDSFDKVTVTATKQSGEW